MGFFFANLKASGINQRDDIVRRLQQQFVSLCYL
jgi:hypothetical protein